MSEKMGRCRREVDDCDGSEPLVAIADAIDRLAADVAAIKAKTSDIEWEAVQHFVESEKAWVALVTEQRDEAIRERDEARAEVVTAMEQRGIAVMQRDAAITRRDDAEAEVERLEAKLAARQPAAPPGVWLTGEERAQLRFTLDRMRRLKFSKVAEAIESIVNRAGSPPVVVLPGFVQHSSLGDKLVALRQVKDALDKAGVAWKEVGRE